MILKVKDLKKSFKVGKNRVDILKGISFEINEGEMVAITGPSGAGKSTLLHLLGTLDKPSSGEIILNGRSIENERDFFLAKIRNEMIGFVFQFHFLLPEFTALENVMIPILVGGKSRITSREKAQKLLLDLDMSARMNHRPSELSGGEQQRVAISRSLVNNPDLLLADEMTGNLDENTAEEIFNFFLKYINKNKTSLIYVTHNKKFSKMAEEQYYLKDKLLFKINE